MKISNLIELSVGLTKTTSEGNLARYSAMIKDDQIKINGYGNNQSIEPNNFVPGHDIVAVVFNTDLNDTNVVRIVVAGQPSHRGVMMLKIGGLPFHSSGRARYVEPNHPVLKNTIGVTTFSLVGMEFITLKEGPLLLELYYEPTKPVVYIEPIEQPEKKG